MKIFLALLIVLIACALPCWSQQADEAPAFSDVPADHWAADAVRELAGEGILKGYPDGTFKGDQPVTRFELAVALARFTELLAPAANSSEKLPKDTKTGPTMSSKVPAWVLLSTETLITGKFLPTHSPIITDGSKPATMEDLAQALASISARIVELRVPSDPETVE